METRNSKIIWQYDCWHISCTEGNIQIHPDPRCINVIESAEEMLHPNQSTEGLLDSMEGDSTHTAFCGDLPGGDGSVLRYSISA
ncbi:hypothetical protein AV530_012466 [Patagioenas fasciata monilis]|uniref:Uncharacterized protein n=1 Tax=Patagioenas fasciata monilis TaxID=372326 RepID=A0A1V4JB55_PATFA|nr:hypothetical protein AV530_012466 [Patagioenas fasciata monilis]